MCEHAAVQRRYGVGVGWWAGTLARQACEARGAEDAFFLDTLAAACAANGEMAEAVRWAERVLALRPEFAGGKERLACYRSGRAWEVKE